MRTIFFLLFTVLLFACKGKTEELSVHEYKVIGLSDSLVSDSVWKMIFTIEGIEELVVNPADSLITVTVKNSEVKEKALKKEIEARGAKFIKR